jgi:ABC-type sugar transport system permease subunit
MTATHQPPTSQPGQQLSGQQTVARQAVIRQPAEPSQPPGQHAAPRQPSGRLSLRAAGARLAGSGTGGTPAVLRSLLTGLVAAALVWGVFAAWAVDQHASAASQVANASERLTFAAQEMYQKLSDADVTVTTAYLAGASVPLGVRQHYEADIARAEADLATLRSGSGSASAQFTASLTSVSVWLPLYDEFVGKAQAYNSAGHQPTGGSFMQVASEVMHLKLLPAANSLYAQESASLGSVSAQATGLTWIVVALVFAAAIGFALLRTQRWLHRRTHRRVNYGLAWASVAVIAILAWLAIAFTSARSDLENGLRHGSTPAQDLAQASTFAQRARGDEVLNVISRTGSMSFKADFDAMRHMIGPGPKPGTQLALAAAASSGQGATGVVTAEWDARSWYAVTEPVFSATNYAGETEHVLGKERGSSYAQFNKLQADLRLAIKADQATFTASATAGSDAFGGLEFGVILAALVMMVGSAWGLSRRLAEYR